MVLLREKTLDINRIPSLNSYAKCGNSSCLHDNHIIEDEEIEAQRGNFWPKFTRKVGDKSHS